MKRYKFRILWVMTRLGFNIFLRNTATQNAGFLLMIVSIIALVSGLDCENDLLTGCAVILGVVAYSMIGDAAEKFTQQ